MQVAPRRGGRRHIPQDPLRRGETLDRVGPEQGGTAALQGAREPSREAAVGETGKEEGRGAQRRGGRGVFQDLDGGCQHVGVVRQVAGVEQGLVAAQHGGDQRLSAREWGAATTRQRGGPDAPQAERGHRITHRVTEPHLLGETGEVDVAAGAECLVDGPLHQRVFVEGVDDRAARERESARNDFRCEGT